MTRDVYRRLDPAKIVTTASALRDRVAERFPGAGLALLAADVVLAASQTAKRGRSVARPYLALRLLVFGVVAGGVAAGLGLFHRLGWRPLDLPTSPFELAQGMDAVASLALLTTAGAWFLMTLEARWKRQRIQTWLHELRAFAHVVDMHQLTKDPTAEGGPRTTSSPDRGMSRYDLTRYLDYCAEILALIGKLAAIYAGGTQDHLAIAAAGDVENLCSDLNRKVWQKIMILAEARNDAQGQA